MTSLNLYINILLSKLYIALSWERGIEMNNTTMHLNLLKDEELAALYQNNIDDQNIFNEIHKRYIKLIQAKSRVYFIQGAESEDVIQEGLIGLMEAIKTYNPDKKASFSTFALLCITRRIQDAVNRPLRLKNSALNNYISFDYEGSEDTFSQLTSKYNRSAEEEYLTHELSEQIKYIIDNILSEKERILFMEFISGKSYKQISKEMNEHTKTVDNAIQRARKKILAYTKGF